MYVRVTELQFWKSEHDERTCEDSLAYDVSKGVFAIADGAGTAGFSSVWAGILTAHCVQEPLASQDPFEVQWWLRRAQKKYEISVPSWKDLPPQFQEKAREGSASTLAILNFLRQEDGRATALLLAIGDSCVFVRSRASTDTMAFPLQSAVEFSSMSLTLPTRSDHFVRDFHVMKSSTVELQVGDLILMATDEISKWVLRDAENAPDSVDKAITKIAALGTDEEWRSFVLGCRQRKEMNDDDCFALVLSITDNSTDLELGMIPAPDPILVQARTQEVKAALQADDSKQLAISYGDGQMVQGKEDISTGRLERAQLVADALDDLSFKLRSAYRQSQDTAHLSAKVSPVWEKHAAILHGEPCADQLLSNLERLGIPNPIKEKAIERFRQACEDGDEREILKAYNPILHEYTGLTSSDLDKLQAAENCVVMVESVQRAIESDDDAEIVATYDPQFARDWSFTSEQELRIRQAQEREASLRPLREALDDGLDLLILDAAEFLDPEVRLTTEQKSRIEVARHRAEKLVRFQQALATDDAVQILQSYDQALDECLDISMSERRRLEEARHWVAMHEAVVQAIERDDDTKIANVYDPELASHFAGFTEQAKQRIAVALPRAMKLAQFYEAVASDNDAQISVAYSELLDADIVPNEQGQQRANLARKRLEALERLALACARAGDDDEAILEAYDSADDILSDLKPDLACRLRLAHGRSTLRHALRQGDELWVMSIFSHYQDVLDRPGCLSDREFAQVQESKDRVEALRKMREAILSDDDFAIVRSTSPLLLGNESMKPEEAERLCVAFQRLAWLWSIMHGVKHHADQKHGQDPGSVLQRYARVLSESQVVAIEAKLQPTGFRKIVQRFRTDK